MAPIRQAQGRPEGRQRRKASGKLKIKWVRSWIACTERQRACVRGLGLRRLNQVVERADTPAVRGLVNAVPHLVEIVED